jgi:hypothetical protein
MTQGDANTNGVDGSITVTIPEGYYTGVETTTAIDANLIGANIKPTVTIFGVPSSMTAGDANTDGVDGNLIVTIPE